VLKKAADRAGLIWKESNYLALRRGPYLIGAGLDESIVAPAKWLKGRFVNLFDPELKVQHSVELAPGIRVFLMDLDALKAEGPQILASACKVLPIKHTDQATEWAVEGVGETTAIVLISTAKPPRSIQLDQQTLESYAYDADEKLLRVRFPNEAWPRNLVVEF